MCVLVYSMGIVWNELICGYANVVHTSSSFCPHTHIHTHTHICIFIPFEDCELMGLKVDITGSFPHQVTGHSSAQFASREHELMQ